MQEFETTSRQQYIHKKRAQRKTIREKLLCWIIIACSASILLSSFLAAHNKDDSTKNHRRILSSSSSSCSSHPDWIENGGVVIYFVFICYLFLGISIICEDYFVKSLKVICQTLQLSDDIAGATFMAAGSSAPELFSSLVSLTNDNASSELGIGTIVGSAVFNILVIIGVSAAFSGRELSLNPTPIIRDCVFYAAAIIGVSIFFSDGKVYWWEGLISVALYGVYLAVLKYFMPLLKLCFELETSGDEAKQSLIEPNPGPESSSSAVDEEAATQSNGNGVTAMNYGDDSQPKLDHHPGDSSVEPPSCPPSQPRPRLVTTRTQIWGGAPLTAPAESEHHFEIPKTTNERIVWVLSLPWYVAFTFTVPDCEKPKWKNWYLVSFALSILWIGIISWFMVEWTQDIGCILGIPPAVMGVTVLAAGTSIPDALASISVAKEGKGDMAVANAVGSNIFDIWLGLGLPWLFVIPFKGHDSNLGHYIEVDNGELIPSVIILFGVLLFYLGSILFMKWKLFPKEGYLFMGLYVVYALYYIIAVWALDIFNSDD